LINVRYIHVPHAFISTPTLIEICHTPQLLLLLLSYSSLSLSLASLMASSSRPSTHKQVLYILVAILILLINSSWATRHGRMMMKTENNHVMTTSLDLKHHEIRKRNPGLVFNFLPKGQRVPYSGPSKRHNSMVDSSHN